MTAQQEADQLLSIFQQYRGIKMQNTSDILERIQSKGEWLKRDAQGLADFISLLSIRRDFPTLAEEAMDNAEAELIAALKTVRLSRAAYNAKPVERSLQAAE